MQTDEPLDKDELDELNDLLARGIRHLKDDEVPDYLPVSSVPELDGFLTAIVSGPELLPPSIWLPEILEEGRPSPFPAAQATRVIELVFRHMNGIATALMDDPESFCPLEGVIQIDGGEQTIVAPWCMGFMRAYELNFEAWIEVLGAPGPVEHPLTAIIFFGTDMWLSILETGGESEEETSDLFAYMKERLPEDVRELHAVFLERRESGGGAEMDFMAEPVAPIRRSTPRVGRNDPCPCGSGRKYKKCCLQ